MASPPCKRLRADPGKAGDPRLGSLIVDAPAAGKLNVGLVWFPFDEGTLRNGGRGGSSGSPEVVARMLQKMGAAINPEEKVNLADHLRIVEVGEAVGATMEEAHTSLEALVAKALAGGMVPIVVGGSNDQSYPNTSAWLGRNPASRTGTVINIDAHFDVRPYVDGRRHSGSPFFSLLEDGRFSGRLVEFAAQGSQCSQEHTDYIEQRKGTIFWLGALREHSSGPAGAFREMLSSTPGPVFVSFDVDSIAGRDMPGVSCPSPVGLSAEEAIAIARAAGACPKVEMLDLSELNVAIEADRSPRLVVVLIYSFLLGLAQRRATEPRT